MAELEDAPWVSEGASDLPDAPWDSSWSRAVTGVPQEAWRTTKEMAHDTWENIKGSVTPREQGPGEGFWEGYGRDVAAVPGKFGKFASGVAEAGMLPLAPAIGAAKSLIGRPMAHGIHKVGEYIAPDIAAKQSPEGIYEDIRGDVGTAVQNVLPAKLRSEVPLPGRPRVPENAPPNVRDSLQKRIDALPPEDVPTADGGMGPAEPHISPMTPREGTNARLLPHDYRGTGTAGDPHFDAAWDALGSRGSMGAAGRPGGPLADIHPEAIQTMRDIVREEGLSPWELERRQEEERSPHHFGGEWSDAMRNELRGLNSLGGEGANIIGQSVRARRRDAPERMRENLREFFGERLDPREEAASRKKADAEAAPFWREFDATPIPPTAELAALDDALKVTGAWRGAEKALRTERVPRESYFVELPNTGEYVLANPELPSETISVPTAKFYQAAKVYIDGLIDDAVDRRKTNDVRILTGLKNALTDAIDNHPDPTVAGLWKRSREVSAGPRQWDSAIALGKRAMSEHVDPGDFSMLWDTLSDQQKIGVRKGAHELLGSMLGRKGSADINTMKHVLGDNNQQKLRTMQESEGAADRLISKVEHEHGMAQGPLTGPNTADKLAAQQRYKPKETWAQSLKPGDLAHSPTHLAGMGLKKGIEWKQAKMAEEAQKKQNLINADIARLMTLQGPEWNAVVRYLHGVASEEPSPGAGPRPSPRPAPARPAGEVEPPPPSTVPEGPPGYPQPEMTVMEATKILRNAGYPQVDINRLPGPTRMQTAQHLRDAYPNGTPAEKPEFPGEVTPREAGPAPITTESPLHPKGEKPLSLLEWIRKQGGIDPNDPLVGDVRAMFGGKNPAGIIRKGGKRLDQLREGAVGEKYFLDRGDIAGGEAETTPNTLLDAMLREVDGNKQYPLGSEVGRRRNKDMEARNREQQQELEFSPEARRLDRELGQYGVTRGMMPAGARERAIEMLRSGVETDAVEAFERAVSEQRQAEAQGEHAAEAGEGLEPSPQPGGMAARGQPAAGEGQSGNGTDLRDTGARDREETEPLTRKVLQRGRSGRPIETKPLAIGAENEILRAGARKKSARNEPTVLGGRAEVRRAPDGHGWVIWDSKKDQLWIKEEGAGMSRSDAQWQADMINRDAMNLGPVNRASGGRVDPSAINSNPTEAQKEAGNYAKDHVRVHGLDITIENAKGSKRSGVDKGGKPWSVAMPAAYGYIKKTEGADGDHVDVYLGPHLKSSRVFVVDQRNAETGKFDEHKCLVGFASASQARNCYLKAFSDGKGKARLGAMHEADIDGFKTWLASGDTTKPIGKITA